jgi:2-polyprenyl-3-methyl-5-hydroxy-6-metoxy-1,4-benzoquinol methylase
MRMQTGYDLVVANVEALPFRERFDVIVAGELVEHLYNMGKFLDSAWHSLRNDGVLLISTPNSFSLSKALYSLIAGKEVCHLEHTCYYSPQTLRYVVTQHGFCIKEQIGMARQGRFRALSALYRWVARVRPIMSEIIFVVAQKRIAQPGARPPDSLTGRCSVV